VSSWLRSKSATKPPGRTTRPSSTRSRTSRPSNRALRPARRSDLEHSPARLGSPVTNSGVRLRPSAHRPRTLWHALERSFAQ
jgi:hypothetical protein